MTAEERARIQASLLKDLRAFMAEHPEAILSVPMVEELLEAAIARDREAYTRALQIHVTDLQQWLDGYRESLPANQWARAQGALNGLAAAIRARHAL